MSKFEKFGKRNLEIKTLADERLLMVDPSSEGFFDNVLGVVAEEDSIKAFLEAVKEVQEAGLSPFWRPTLDPSLDEDKVVFKKGERPAILKFFDWWENVGKVMPEVEGKCWRIGTKYQYYAFLVQLINKLVESGWTINKALEAIVLDSKELGNYGKRWRCVPKSLEYGRQWGNYFANSEAPKNYLESTGNHNVCGVCDLANTDKLLLGSNDGVDGFWLASGSYDCPSYMFPLAKLVFYDDVDLLDCGVGWLVLS